MLIWIIDEEWSDYEYEKEALEKEFPGVEIKISTYDYEKDLCDFGYKADGILAQVYADLPASTINRLEKCKGIATYGGGYDRIDVDACQRKGIHVCNIQKYCAEDVADYTIAALYFLNKKISWFSDAVVKDVKEGRWGAQVIQQNDYRLINQVLLIIGLGDIGSVVAKKASALGIKVLAYDEFQNADEMAAKGAEKVSWEEGLRRADYVSVNLKGVDANRNKITLKDFEMMKPSAYLINTARGKIVKEDDMIKAVNEKIISGAVLDVILNEPPMVDDPILHVDRIWITPHVSYITYESFDALKRFAIFNLTAMLRGTEPRDPVV